MVGVAREGGVGVCRPRGGFAVEISCLSADDLNARFLDTQRFLLCRLWTEVLGIGGLHSGFGVFGGFPAQVGAELLI